MKWRGNVVVMVKRVERIKEGEIKKREKGEMRE